jgi:hypothetical protein
MMPDFSRLSRRKRLVLTAVGATVGIVILLGRGYGSAIGIPSVAGPVGAFVGNIVTCTGLLGIILAAHLARGLWPNRRSVQRRHERERGGAGAGAGPEWIPLRWWRLLSAVSRLMPSAPGRRWLAEAASFLAEAATKDRRSALRSYLISTPRVLVVLWVGELYRHARRIAGGRD